jgi:peptidoglycan/xylan/chitin deacetylase (PgdA/CDA1 family)
MLTRVFSLLAGACLLAAQSGPAAQSGNPQFHWPEGKRVAVSLSFDDARASQVDVGMPLLDKYGAKATFFVVPAGSRFTTRLDGWKKAAASGQEIGNHTLTHPCTVNFAWSARNALENYTIPMIDKEMDGGSAEIERLLGVKPVTFAYPCGQKFVGRGTEVKSYVPEAAKRYLAARGYLDEGPNDPAQCDFAQIMGMGSDGLTWEQIRSLVNGAEAQHGWLVLAGHEIGTSGYQVTAAAAVEELLKYARDPANGVWLDTVQAIAKYILAQRSGPK